MTRYSLYPIRLVACVAALQFLCATTVVAQRAAVMAVFGGTSHDLLDSPFGPAFSLATPLGRRVELSLMVSRLDGSSDGTGVVCGGLINPDRCPSEPFTQKGRLSLVGIGADVHLATTRMATLSFQPQFVWGRARSETNGKTTGNSLFSDRAQLGFTGGLELRAFPAPRRPLGLVVGGTVGRLGPAQSDQIVDGYTPFNDWYGVHTLYAGLAWEARRR
jgi:hypothetical protein